MSEHEPFDPKRPSSEEQGRPAERERLSTGAGADQFQPPPFERDSLEAGAVRGTAVLFVRTIGLQGLAFGATLVLANVLSPAEYGAFAVASVIQQLGRGLTDTALAAGVIQQENPPTPRQQHALTGIGLAVGSALAVAAIALAVGLWLLGVDAEIPQLAAITCLSLPILGAQVVPLALLERNMRFARFSTIEAVCAVVFYAVAIAGVLAGFGPYALGAAVPLSVVVSYVMANRLQPWDRGIAFDLDSIRPLLGFGSQVTASYMLSVGRELGLVGGMAALGSQAFAGFYDMSRRLLSLPTALLISITRVGFSALTRVREADREANAVKAAGVSAVAAGLPLAVLAGAAEPLLSTLFGAEWLPAADVVRIAAPGLLLYVGAGTILARLALARGNARVPLIAEASQTATAIAAIGLVPALGVSAAGIAVCAGFVANTGVMLANSTSGARRCLWPVLRELAVATVAALVGVAVAGGEQTAIAALTSIAATSASWLLLSLLLTRSELALLWRLLDRHIFGEVPLPGGRSARQGLG
jgi:O-antigen/teichoic acid export membrane protein